MTNWTVRALRARRTSVRAARIDSDPRIEAAVHSVVEPLEQRLLFDNCPDDQVQMDVVPNGPCGGVAAATVTQGGATASQIGTAGTSGSAIVASANQHAGTPGQASMV